MKTILSSDRLYRYTLWRQWDATNPTFVQFIGLNPSTADEALDDPTVRRCMSFAKAWGFGALCMTNLFAYRATNPRRLKACDDPIGAENDHYLEFTAKSASAIVAVWGERGTFLKRNQKIIERFGNLQCLDITKQGHPKHPLYVKKAAKLRVFRQAV